MEINTNGPSPLATGRSEAQPRQPQAQQTQTETAIKPSDDSGPSKRSSGNSERGQNVDITV